MSRRAAPLLALLLTGGLLACAGLPGAGGSRASEEERRAYAAALALRAEDPRQAERALAAFVEEHPESPLADDASLSLAELALERGALDAALLRYEWVVRNQPGADRADVARVEIARIQASRGDTSAAAASLAAVNLSRLSRPERRSAFRVLADVATDPVEKLRWLAKLRASNEGEAELQRIDVEIDDTIRPLDRPDLLRAAEQLGREIPAARVLVRAADQALDQGDLLAASEAVERARRLPIAPVYEARLAIVSERLHLLESGPLADGDLPSFAEVAARPVPSTSGAEGTLGVVLPLTGPFARFGEESLQGVLLAAGVFGESYVGLPRVRVLVRDSGGRPDLAARAVHELAEAGVVAIVGPLLKGECEAAAAAAEEAGVPLVALTAREEISALRPHVFRVRTQPREEVDALVHHAIQKLGAKRFAILYPNDGYGRGQRRLFWRAVEDQGGRLVAIASYDPGATDFSDSIRRLVGYALLGPTEKAILKERDAMESRARRLPTEQAMALREEARALTGPGGQPLPPFVDFDALFIPESHEKVVLIAPQLAFHEVTGATLLGPNGWNDPEVVRLGRNHVEGARFTAQYWPESELPTVRDFAARFAQAYAGPADVLAAQAYDAANLVLVQLARGRSSREDVREGVLAVTGYPGVSGVLTMRADGNARKRPFLLAIERGRVVQVD